MKKNIHSPLYLINVHCISCLTEYQNYSTAEEDQKIEVCINCFTRDSSEIKVGKAEKFRQRQQKAQESNQ